MAAASPSLGSGRLLTALEVDHNDGPWDHPDSFRKVNGLLRYSQGDTLSEFTLTAMGYHGSWNSSDQIPERAVTSGLIDRFGTIDPSDGGHSYRYSGSLEWQRTIGSGVTKIVGYGIGYDLDLFSDFTYRLEDPVHGDQFEQADHRVVSGARVTHRRLSRWGSRPVQNTVGVQLRNDDIGNVGLYHTEARKRLDTVRQDAVVETSGAVYAQNEVDWMPRLRTTIGLRADGYQFRVDSNIPENGGLGFHSNDARGATIAIDPESGAALQPVTPLVRAAGAEVGVRTVYWAPVPWLTADVDVSWSRARFRGVNPAGNHIPGAVETVVLGGLTANRDRGPFGSLRLRYFGPRALAEDNSVRSKATSLLNLDGGWALSARTRVSLELFNMLNAADSDIDYFYTSRLPVSRILAWTTSTFIPRCRGPYVSP